VLTPPLTGVQADGEQAGAVQAIMRVLRDLGHEVIEREIDYAPALIGNVLARYLRGIADMASSMPHRERLSRRTRGYRRIGLTVPPPLVERAKAAAAADGQALAAVFEDGVNLVMTPMFTRRPPRIGEYEGTSALRSLNGSIRFVPYCGAYNHTGQPAASVPAGFTPDEFPLAVQLIAPAYGEPVLLSLAEQLEAAIGWADRRPPL
jgi:amidase